jgi:hypothetical protein
MDEEKDLKVEPVKVEEKKPRKLKLPTPMQIILGWLVILIFGVSFKYWGVFIRWVVEGYPVSEVTTWLQVVSLVCFAFLVLFLFVFQYREAWFPFMIAGFKRYPVYVAFTKNKQMKFIVPKEVTWNHIKIDNETTLEPDPNAYYDAPSKVKGALFVPEFAKLLNIRDLLEGKDMNIDITAYQQYAELHAQQMLSKYRNAWSSFQPFIFPLIILITLLVALYPTFEKRISQDGAIAGYQSQIYQCNSRLVANGLTPVNMDSQSATTTTTLKSNTQQPAQPNTGVSR